MLLLTKEERNESLLQVDEISLHINSMRKMNTFATKLIVCGRQRVRELEPQNPGMRLASAVAMLSQLLALSIQTE